ncbi:hypothetical protein CDAR_23651 [Caerostris darwini]|uniref:Uncharacterized protein n=1 Tax=Caerostris darwini TaxID=1538125 RepID=A0AAV4RWP5_9ARAC|nr:hypothetical protein CDAR_23651 [Caerostris darwini]
MSYDLTCSIIDRLNVTAILKYVMKNRKRERLNKRKKFRRYRFPPDEDRPQLHENITDFLDHTIETMQFCCEAHFEENWMSDFDDQDYQILAQYMKQNVLDTNKFSVVDFLSYCCQLGILSAYAYDMGFDRAPCLAEEHILIVLKKYRLKNEFYHKKWTYLKCIVFHHLIDHDLLK